MSKLFIKTVEKTSCICLNKLMNKNIKTQSDRIEKLSQEHLEISELFFGQQMKLSLNAEKINRGKTPILCVSQKF